MKEASIGLGIAGLGRGEQGAPFGAAVIGDAQLALRRRV
jgi:hypothetical protein